MLCTMQRRPDIDQTIKKIKQQMVDLQKEMKKDLAYNMPMAWPSYYDDEEPLLAKKPRSKKPKNEDLTAYGHPSQTADGVETTTVFAVSKLYLVKGESSTTLLKLLKITKKFEENVDTWVTLSEEPEHAVDDWLPRYLFKFQIEQLWSSNIADFLIESDPDMKPGSVITISDLDRVFADFIEVTLVDLGQLLLKVQTLMQEQAKATC